MDDKKVLSFSVLASGKLAIEIPEGHTLRCFEVVPNKFEISSSLPICSAEAIQSDFIRKSWFNEVANIGKTMDDGSVFVGISPSRNRPFFTIAVDQMQKLPSGEVFEHMEQRKYHGHSDWQLATKEEYDYVFKYRRLKSMYPIVGYTRRFWVLSDEGYIRTIHQKKGSRNLEVDTASSKLDLLPIRYGEFTGRHP